MLPFLTAIVAVVVTLLSCATASAATTAGAETRVGASGVVVEPAVGPPEHIIAGQRLGNDGQQVVTVVATGGPANGASRLAESSNSAFRAADNIDDWSVSAKHLPGAGGRWNKWAEGVDINGSVAGGLRSEGASFLPNAGTATDRFIVRTNMGSILGTRGETFVKVVVSNDARIITAYPVK